MDKGQQRMGLATKEWNNVRLPLHGLGEIACLSQPVSCRIFAFLAAHTAPKFAQMNVAYESATRAAQCLELFKGCAYRLVDNRVMAGEHDRKKVSVVSERDSDKAQSRLGTACSR